MDPTTMVLEISSDEEGWTETGGAGKDDCDDYDWLRELLNNVPEGPDSDDVVLVSEVLNPKQRAKSSDAVAKSCLKNAVDDDCMVLDGDPDKPIAVVNTTADDSDDLLVVGEKGQVACRDYPHPRHLCALFPFASTPHVKHCHQCHCYVCDSLAPCRHWGSGVSSLDHCHASDKKDHWKSQRKRSKQSNEPPPIPKVPDASLCMELPQMNTVPSLIPQINFAPQNPVTSTCIRPMPTNHNVPGVTNRNQQPSYVVPRNKFQSSLVSQQSLGKCNNTSPRDRRNNHGHIGTHFVSPCAMFKRTGSPGAASTINQQRHISSNNSYRSGYSRNPSPMAAQMARIPNRLQEYRGVTPESNASWSSSQPNSSCISMNSQLYQVSSSPETIVGGILANPFPQVPAMPNVDLAFTDSVPSPHSVASQPYVSSSIANPESFQPQMSFQSVDSNILDFLTIDDPSPSQPKVTSQPNVGSTSAINSVSSLPRMSSQPNVDSNINHFTVMDYSLPSLVAPQPSMGNVVAGSDCSQPQILPGPNVASHVTDLLPSESQVCVQFTPVVDCQNVFREGNQIQSAPNPSFADFGSNWVDPEIQHNQQPAPTGIPQNQNLMPTDESSTMLQFDPQCVRSTDSLGFDLECWFSENHHVSSAPGLNLLPPEPATIFDF